jgi:hypothetical protein
MNPSLAMFGFRILPIEEVIGPGFVADIVMRSGPLNMGFATIAKFALGARTAIRAIDQ